jgi:RNA polymerase sigma-32 factor
MSTPSSKRPPAIKRVRGGKRLGASKASAGAESARDENEEGKDKEEGEEEIAADEPLGEEEAGLAAPEVLPPEASRSRVGAISGERGLSPLRDPVGRFLAEARRYPRLSEEEERRLGLAVRQHGDVEAARRLVVHNLRLVVAIAYQYRRAWASILDLFQEGSVGLMEAVKRWEPTLGPRFGSYAAYWIRAYVLKFLMTNSRLIHVGNTRAGRKLFFRLEKERQKLLVAGFEPTPKLLAAKLDVDEKELDEVRRHLESREVSFDPRNDRGGDGDEGYALSEKLPLDQASPEERAATAEMSGALHQFMAHFDATIDDDRERAIWREHLAAEEPVPLGVLGARFGVTKQRMGQIADKLKRRFREEIVSRMGSDIRTAWLGEEG